MLLMKRGLCCLAAVRATVIIAVKLGHACMKACSSPITLESIDSMLYSLIAET